MTEPPHKGKFQEGKEGTWFSEYRRKHDLSQAAFAELIGADKQTVYKWEAGLFKPQRGMVYYQKLKELGYEG